MKRVVRVLAGISLLVAAFPLRGGTNAWSSFGGPLGGNVTAFVRASNGDLYAATLSGGVYRLPVGTSTWQSFNKGFFHTSYTVPPLNTFTLAFSPAGDLYAGTNAGDVFVRAAAATRWQPSGATGLPSDRDIRALHFVGNDLFAGTNGSGVFKLVNGSSTWVALNTGLPPGANITSFARDSTDALFAGVPGSGAFKLSNGASSWSSTTGLSGSVTCLALNSANNDVYAGTLGNGVKRLPAGTSVWTSTPGMNNPFVLSLVVDTNGDLYAGLSGGGCCGGVSRLPNGGLLWTDMQSGLDIYRQINAITLANSTIYAGSTRGTFALSGGNWVSVFGGMSAFRINAILRRQNGDLLVGTEGGGIHRYLGAGAWQDYNTGIQPFTLPSEISNLAETPLGDLYASLKGSGVAKGALKRPNAAASWQEFDTGLTNFDVRGLNFNLSDNMLYSATVGGGVFRSTGTSWSPMNNGLPDLGGASLLAAANGDMYVGTFLSGVFRLPLAGTTWTPFNDPPSPMFSNILALGQNRRSGDLWATASDNMYRYPSGGTGWEAQGDGFYSPACPAADVNSFASSSAATGVMWGVTFCGAFRRTLGDSYWVPVNTGLFPPDQGTNTSFSWAQKVFVGGNDEIFVGLQGLPLMHLKYGANANFDGDGRTDVSVFRPSNGGWYVFRSSDAGATNVFWGTAGDKPVAADYDGDGKSDLAVFRPSNGTWYIFRSSDAGGTTVPWGTSGDLPVPADYDGDGKTDTAVFRPSNGTWYIFRSSDAGGTTVPWGTSGDLPVPADYDGDGKTDVAVFRPSNGAWYIFRSSDAGMSTAFWGLATDVLVPADYDGDLRADLAVFRPSNGTWYIQRSSGDLQPTRLVLTTGWGASGDLPVPADYDGDGQRDIAVFRPANGGWYVVRSSGGTSFLSWGISGDIPASKPVNNP